MFNDFLTYISKTHVQLSYPINIYSFSILLQTSQLNPFKFHFKIFTPVLVFMTE